MHHVCVKTKIFKSGNSKAVRIPASIRLFGPEVKIIDLGENGVLLKELTQPRDPWDLIREGLAELGGEWPYRVQEKGPEEARMVKYLLDASVLIECLHRNPKMAETVMGKGEGHELAVSSVTYGELMVGILKNDTPRRRRV